MSSPVDPQAAAEAAEAVRHYAVAAPVVADTLRSAIGDGPVHAFTIRAEGEVLVCWLVVGRSLVIAEAAADATLTIAIPLTRVRRVQEGHTAAASALLVEVDADATRTASTTAATADGTRESTGTLTPAAYVWSAPAGAADQVGALRRFAGVLRACL